MGEGGKSPPVSYLINNSNFEETVSREVIGKKLPATHMNCSIGIRLPTSLTVKEELGHPSSVTKTKEM